MRTSRSLALAVLVALLLVFSVPSAFAAGPVTTTHEIVDGTVTWTIPQGQCAELPYELSGAGDRHMVIITQTNADGSMVIRINDVVKGTAWDDSGTYKFSYTNESSESVPAGGGAHQIQMTDTFLLNGNGSAKLNVGFNWRWTYDPSVDAFWPPVHDFQQLSTRGDPFTCDPI